METMLPFKLILCLLILGMTSCQHVSDVLARSQTRSSYLQQAINYLVNYTATETETHMDMNDIGSRVAAIAYEKLTENLARTHPQHCNDYLSVNKPVTSSVTLIQPDDGEPFYVYCNMEHFGGGWTRIQHRSTSRTTFRRDWDAYREGFGYLSGDGWLGLEKIHRLTKNNTAQLLITVRDTSYNYYFAQYRKFMIGSEDTEYTLYIGNYTGDAGDSLSYSNYVKFSTYDEDNDLVSSTNCASSYRGGWWYKGSNCFQGKLNGDAYSSSTSYSSSSSRYYMLWPGVSSTTLYSATMEIKISPD